MPYKGFKLFCNGLWSYWYPVASCMLVHVFKSSFKQQWPVGLTWRKRFSCISRCVYIYKYLMFQNMIIRFYLLTLHVSNSVIILPSTLVPSFSINVVLTFYMMSEELDLRISLWASPGFSAITGTGCLCNGRRYTFLLFHTCDVTPSRNHMRRVHLA